MLEWPDFPDDVRLSTADIDAVLDSYGVPTVVRRGAPCDCISLESRQPAERCASCVGWGLIYPENREVTLDVQWVGHSAKVQAERGGVVELGDFTATWPTDTPLARGDLFVHPNEETVIPGEMLVRGRTDPQGASTERLRYDLVVAVEEVRRGPTVYVEDTDWSRDGQAIEWLDGGDAPPDGSLYSVRYRVRSQYAVWPHEPRQRSDGGQRLPWTAALTRFSSLSRQAGSLGAP